MEETNQALKKIVRGAGIFSIGLIISKIFGYAYRLVIARIGAEQYGLLSIALAFFGILVAISLLGMSEGITRFISFYKGKLDQRRIKGTITSALKISLPLSLFLGLFLFFFSDWISLTYFHNAQLSILFKIFAFAIPLDSLRSILINSLVAFQKVEYEVYAKNLAENISKVILTLVAVYLGFGIIGAAIAYLFSILISFIFSFYFLEKKVFPIVKTEIVSITSNKELLLYSLPLLLASFVFLIIQWTDTLMIGYFKTSYDVGIYNVALPTVSLLCIFPLAVRTLFFPVLSELYAQNKKGSFKKIYRTTIKWNIMVNSVVFIFLVIFSKQIIQFLFGNAYIKDQIFLMGYKFPVSALTLIVLSLGIAPAEFFRPYKDVLLVLKRTKLIFFNNAIGTISNIILNYTLIPPYGIIGAAIATAFAYFIITALFCIETYFITRINPFKSESIKVLFLVLSLMISMILLKIYLIENIIYIVLIFLIFLIVYFVLLLITRSFDEEDKMIWGSIKQKIIRLV